MRRASLALVIPVCVGPAMAQTVGVTIDIDQPILEPGESTTVRLVAHFPASDYALGAVVMDLLFDGLAAEPRDSWRDLRLLPPFDGPGPPLSLDADRISDIIAGQIHFPPAGILADPTNPIAFFEATFIAPLDAGGGYRVDLLTSVSRFDVYFDRERGASESRLDLLAEGSASIHVVPAPASAVVLILGLVTARRCRR